MSDLVYRLRIRDASTVANPDGTTDALVISSLASDANPYVLEPPSGDGQSVDPLTGKVSTGAFTLQVIDAVTSGTDRVVTAQLADADGRQQLLSRRAYIEQSTTGGLTWSMLVAGYVNAVRLIDALTYEIAVGETRRIEIATKIFQHTTDGFSNGTCHIGGPVRGGFGPVTDHGPTVWRVALVGTVDDDAGRKLVALQHVRGWWPDNQQDPDWHYLHGALTADARARANAGLQTMQTTGHPVDLAFGLFDGIVGLDGLDLLVRTAGSGGAYTTMIAGAHFDVFSGIPALISPSDRLVLWWEGATPTVGAEIELYAQSTDVSEATPLHVDLHPVDILTTLWGEAGILCDAAAAAGARASLGANLRLKLRITEATTLAEFVERVIYGPFGLATRVDDAGRLVLFSTRIRLETVPGVTWTNDDLADPDTVLFDLDERTVVNSVTIKGQRFAAWSSTAGTARPMDDLVPVPVTRGVDNADVSTFGAREIVYEIPGLIASDASDDGDLLTMATAIGQQVFDRYGRGAIGGTLRILASAPQVELGAEVILDLPQMPNRSVRGGQRIVQVVQRTPVAGVGFDYEVIDSGSTAQPATQPTFTLAADPANPSRVARVTLTNLAALAAEGPNLGLVLQYAVGTTTPAGDGMQFFSANAATYLSLGLPTTIPTPPVAAGSIIAVRARSLSYQERPSAWTAWQSVTLDALTGPSAVTATPVPGDDTAMDLAWTVGDTEVPVEVDLRLSSEPVEANRVVARLPAASDGMRLSGLDTATTYTASVRLRSGPTMTPFATATFTTGGGAPVLAAPTNPVGVVGRPTIPVEIGGFALMGYTRTVIDGTFGLDVTVTERLGAVVFEVAVETGVGTDTPGAFAEAGRVPPVPNARTRFRAVAPYDKRRRYLRAKVHRTGLVDSPYCATVRVDPWGDASPPDQTPIPAPAFALSTVFEQLDSIPTFALRITFDEPTSPYYARTRFTITPDDGSGARVVETVGSPKDVPAVFGVTYTVVAQAITTAGTVGDPSAAQEITAGLHPGIPIGFPIFDPGAYTPGEPLAPPIGFPSLSITSDGLTLHDQMLDSDGRNVTATLSQALSDAADAIAAAAGAQATADGKVTTYFQDTPPVGANEGDLWLDTDDGNRLHRWNATAGAWTDVQDASIGEAITAAADAQATADSKVQTFYAPSAVPPTAEGVGDLWYLTDLHQVKRWSGSAWVAVQGPYVDSAANMLVNGGGQQGAVGQAAPGWVKAVGADLTISDTHAKFGDRSLHIAHAAANLTAWRQDVSLVSGHVYRLSGWIELGAVAAGTDGSGDACGAYLDINNAANLTFLDRIGDVRSAGSVAATGEAGVAATGAAVGPRYVAVVVRANATFTTQAQLLFTTIGAGNCWYDGLVFEELAPAVTQGGKKADDALDDNARLRNQQHLNAVTIAGPRSLQTDLGGNRVTVLSAFDAGSSPTITVGDHYLRLDTGAVHYPSGSIVGLSYNITYYVYADDPTLSGDAGGTVTYQKTQTLATIVGVSGRYFVGTIRTPAVGGTSSGDNGGGAGPPTQPT